MNMNRMTEPPNPWDRLPTETIKSYAAFRAYCAMGAKRSVREAAHQNYIESASSGSKKTRHGQWLHWSAKHKWVSRADARDAWLARTADELTAANLRECLLALTETALKLLKSGDGPDFLRAARALALHFPPIQRVADVSEGIEDLSDLSDEQLDRMKAIRDAARSENDPQRLPH